jgi:hypothetical protein
LIILNNLGRGKSSELTDNLMLQNTALMGGKLRKQINGKCNNISRLMYINKNITAMISSF